LSRWLDQPTKTVAILDEAATLYLRDGSWVDWARHQLLSGDEPEAVGRSYRRLYDRVTGRREQENRGFATLLKAATAANQLGLGLPIEHVLDRVVAPLARKVQAGVLVIVMDGMSIPVLRELSPDLARHGWLEWMPAKTETWGFAITALPSTTSFSRASLLCGALTPGTQNVERRGFEEHSGLRAAGKSAFPPVLFLKDELGASGSDLAEIVRVEIGNSNRKVVGVVVNVVDDSLEGPEQLAIRWTLDQVPVLRALLSEARDAGRAVILLSDHGHVLDHGSTLSRRQDASDRWRPASADPNPSADELVVCGPRVLVDGQHFVAPMTESLRYTPNRRQGYHGGLTPQECLAPISVVAPSVVRIEDWQMQPATPPDWWFDTAEEVAIPGSPTVSGKGRPKPRPALPLFEAVPKPADWVAILLTSEVFVQQMEVFGGRLKRDQVEQVLRLLVDRNGVQMKSALTQRLGIPPIRIDGFLASVQRILNVDGYPVLTSDASQTIRLNLRLLREQFETSKGADNDS
jgi:hypothetical protein